MKVSIEVVSIHGVKKQKKVEREIRDYVLLYLDTLYLVSLKIYIKLCIIKLKGGRYIWQK